MCEKVFNEGIIFVLTKKTIVSYKKNICAMVKIILTAETIFSEMKLFYQRRTRGVGLSLSKMQESYP